MKTAAHDISASNVQYAPKKKKLALCSLRSWHRSQTFVMSSVFTNVDREVFALYHLCVHVRVQFVHLHVNVVVLCKLCGVLTARNVLDVLHVLNVYLTVYINFVGVLCFS